MTVKDDGLRSSRYWQDRADEARAKAAEMRSSSAQSVMLEIAAKYERMADRAALREATGKREASE
jgi:hypothetical protein